MPVYRVVLLVALFVVTGGCSSFKAPGIAVVDASLVESTAEASRLDVHLEIMNPNDEAMELREFSYSFTFRGKRAYTGRWSLGRTLAPGHLSKITLPAVVAIDSDAASEPTWAIHGKVLYVSPGALAELLLDAEVREPSARFHGEGTLQLAGADGQ